MKTAALLLALMAWTALGRMPGYAAGEAVSRAPGDVRLATSATARTGHTGHEALHASVSSAHHPVPLHRGSQGLPSRAGFAPPTRSNPRGVGEGNLAPNEAGHNTLPGRIPSTLRSGAPPLGTVRHRGSNPAIVAGVVNPGRRSNGSIDGTRVSRKP